MLAYGAMVHVSLAGVEVAGVDAEVVARVVDDLLDQDPQAVTGLGGHGPLDLAVLGETLTVGSRIASIRERGGHGFLTIEVSLTAQDGGPVATTFATLLERAAG